MRYESKLGAWLKLDSGGKIRLAKPADSRSLPEVKLHLDNLPPSLALQRETLARCLEAMNQALPLRAVYLFGSHARGEARPDSDVDLCLVADGAERQLQAAQQFRRAIWDLRGKPAFTLVPITPARLEEKQAMGDFFFKTILNEGVPLATEN
jgi:uncharacterized protein